MVINESLFHEITYFLRALRDNELALVEYDITFEEMHYMLFPPDMREHFLIVAKNAEPRPAQVTWDAADGVGGKCVVYLNNVPCRSGYPLPIVPKNGWGCGQDEIGNVGRQKVEDAFHKVRAITMAWDEVIDDISNLRRTAESMQDMHSFMPSIYPILESISLKGDNSPECIRAIRTLKEFKNEWRMPKHNPYMFEQSKRFKESDTTISIGMVLPKAKHRTQPVTIKFHP